MNWKIHQKFGGGGMAVPPLAMSLIEMRGILEEQTTGKRTCNIRLQLVVGSITSKSAPHSTSLASLSLDSMFTTRAVY